MAVPQYRVLQESVPHVVAANHRDGSISGLVVEYIAAIDVTRVRFPADALWDVQPGGRAARLSHAGLNRGPYGYLPYALTN